MINCYICIYTQAEMQQTVAK